MRFTCEFIVSLVDLGVNPLAASESITKMGTVCFSFYGEKMMKAL
jgi:hypothetical protein